MDENQISRRLHISAILKKGNSTEVYQLILPPLTLKRQRYVIVCVLAAFFTISNNFNAQSASRSASCTAHFCKYASSTTSCAGHYCKYASHSASYASHSCKYSSSSVICPSSNTRNRSSDSSGINCFSLPSSSIARRRSKKPATFRRTSFFSCLPR